MSLSYPVKKRFESAWINKEQYETLYQQSVEQPDVFWAEQARRLAWFKTPTQIRDVSFDHHDVHIRWYQDGTLNASYNCLDRHLESRGNQPAILWEGDQPGEERVITYAQLHAQVCRFANVLKSKGVNKGDVVTIYMPMIPEVAVAMLACARIGAIHSVVFGGFSPEALANRIENGESKIVVTADQGYRAGRAIPLKKNVDEALTHLSVKTVEHVIVVKRTGGDIEWHEARDRWYHDEVQAVSDWCEPVEVGAEDPLFILYTSGSTGAPKGVLHTTGGYLTYTSLTHQYVFDYHEGDIYWCTADMGWITGHSYVLYGPLANGATSVMYEGVPNHPDSSRIGRIVDKYNVNIVYTAPTAIRALMADGDDYVKQSSRQSLKVLASAGEPINPEAWRWFYEVFGNEQCGFMDTWWQTETGGIMITPLPGATTVKPGSATRPFFGVQPALVDAAGELLEGAVDGNLVILDSWPAQARTIFGDHERFVQTYFSTFKGMYFSGDGARRDEDGYFWITGRVDDVLNVSGHRLGTAEIESAMVAHPLVAEAAVVGYPHHIKGQGIYIYTTLKSGNVPSDELKKELIQWVRKEIGPVATPDVIQWAPGLPKTRSGKIMRRILRKIAADDFDSLGDTSTLADPAVIDHLIEHRENRLHTR